MDNDEKKTLVEEGTEFSGKLKAKCRVVVKGEIDGELEAPAVDVADTGSVTGTLKAQRVTSHGAIKGTIEVDDITLAGKVHSDTTIRAKTLEVKPATQAGDLLVTFGDCVLEIGDMSADQPTVDDKPSAETNAQPQAATMQAAEEAKPEASTEPTAEAKPDESEADGDAEASSEADGEGDVSASGESARRRKRRRKNKHRGEANAESDASAAPEDSSESAANVDRPQA